MDADTMEMYWLGITMIEAQDVLIQLNISDYPNMKSESRKKFHRNMHEMAYPQVHSDLTPIYNLEEAAQMMGALINGK